MKFLLSAIAVAISGSTFASTLTATFTGDNTGSIFKVTFDDGISSRSDGTMYLDQANELVDWTTADSYLTQFSKQVDRQHVEVSPTGWTALRVESISDSVPVVLDFQGTPVHVLVAGGSMLSTMLTVKNFDMSSFDTTKPGWSNDFYAKAKGATFEASYSTDFGVWPASARLISTDGPLTLEQVNRYWSDGLSPDLLVGPISQQHPELSMSVSENMHLTSVTATVPEPSGVELVLSALGVLAVGTKLGVLGLRRTHSVA